MSHYVALLGGGQGPWEGEGRTMEAYLMCVYVCAVVCVYACCVYVCMVHVSV